MTDQVMSDSSRMSFSRYITTLTDSTLEQMANQLMEEDPNSEELELITDEIELRQIRARGPLYTLEEAASRLTRLFHPDFSDEEHAAQVQRTLAVLQYHADKLKKKDEEG